MLLTVIFTLTLATNNSNASEVDVEDKNAQEAIKKGVKEQFNVSKCKDNISKKILTPIPNNEPSIINEVALWLNNLSKKVIFEINPQKGVVLIYSLGWKERKEEMLLGEYETDNIPSSISDKLERQGLNPFSVIVVAPGSTSYLMLVGALRSYEDALEEAYLKKTGNFDRTSICYFLVLKGQIPQ